MDVYNKIIRPLLESTEKNDYTLEKEIGLPRGTIYDWNNGRSSSYMKHIDKLADYFQVTSDFLLGKKIASPQVEELAIKIISNSEKFEDIFIKLSHLNDEQLKQATKFIEFLGN